MIEKSPEKIKAQIEFWFLKYFGKEKKEFNGTERFTLFDALGQKLKKELIDLMNLRSDELPVLILKITDDQFIINTTERFIRLIDSKMEYLDYTRFSGHDGFELHPTTNMPVKELPNGKLIFVKSKGYLAAFRLMKRDGGVVTWEIPTGTPGFAFWNATKRCELIGRKYLTNRN